MTTFNLSTASVPVTTLGTPLSPHATKVMLLGSGELGKEVLIALQRLGVETIATDRYENAPGQQVAHHARTITMSDPAQLKALIEQERPHLVVPEIEAIATPMLEALEAAGVVRVVPTARAARAVGTTRTTPAASSSSSIGVAIASISGTTRCGRSCSIKALSCAGSLMVMVRAWCATCWPGAFS